MPNTLEDWGDIADKEANWGDIADRRATFESTPEFAEAKQWEKFDPSMYELMVHPNAPTEALGDVVNVIRGGVTDIINQGTGAITKPLLGTVGYDPTKSNIAEAYKAKALPVDKSNDELAKEHPILATAADTSQGALESSPLLAIGALDLPAIVGKAVALGFSARMIAGVKDLAVRYGIQMGLLPEQRNPALIANLRSQLIQTGIFAPLAGAHGASDVGSIANKTLNPDLAATLTKQRSILGKPPMPDATPEQVAVFSKSPPQTIDQKATSRFSIPQDQAAKLDALKVAPASPPEAATAPPVRPETANPAETPTAIKTPPAAPQSAETPIPTRNQELDALKAKEATGDITINEMKRMAVLDSESKANNGRAAFEAAQAKAGLPPLPKPESQPIPQPAKPVETPASAAGNAKPQVGYAIIDSSGKTVAVEKDTYKAQAMADNIGGTAGKYDPHFVEPISDKEVQPVRIKSAAIRSDDGTIYTGAWHPSAYEQYMKDKGVSKEQVISELKSGKITDGFLTTDGKFVSRDAAATIASKSNQFKPDKKGDTAFAGALKGLDHNSEIIPPSSTPNENEPEIVQHTPLGEDIHHERENAPQDVMGVRQKTREKMAGAGHDVVADVGEGRNLDEALENGRSILAKDPKAADKSAADFEASGRKKISEDDFDVARAKYEEVMADGRNIESKFGTDSKKYAAARDAGKKWSEITKDMSTVWGRIGHGQQGETDIDTGSVLAMEVEHNKNTGEDFTPAQRKTATEKAAQINKADETAAKPIQAAIDEITKESDANKPSPYIRQIVERVVKRIENEAAAARQRIKARSGRIMSGLDPTDLADRAIIGAEYIAHGVEDFGEWSKKMTGELGKMLPEDLKWIYEKAKQFARKIAMSETGVKNPDAIVKSFRKSMPEADRLEAQKDSLEKQIADKQRKIASGDIAAKTKTERPSPPEIDALKKQRDDLNKQIAQMRNPPKSVTLESTLGQFKDFPKGGKMSPDQTKFLWQYAKTAYIDTGEKNFHNIYNGISADLGIPVDDIRRGMGQNQKVTKLLDDAYVKQNVARQLKNQAKIWLQQQGTPAAIRAVQKVPQELFNVTVLGHFATWPGTHAAQHFYDPTAWPVMAKSYKEMYRIVGNRGHWEVVADNITRTMDKDGKLLYGKMLKSGLDVNPYTNKEGYKTQSVGGRTAIVLKVIRTERFRAAWDKFPAEYKQGEQGEKLAKLLADDINHSTATVTKLGAANPWSSLFLFAPRMISARLQWEVTDPMKALIVKVMRATGSKGTSRWNSPEANQIANHVLTKRAIFLGTYAGLLGVNQALLMSGILGDNKQKLNILHPFKNGHIRSDWLAFKGYGIEVRPFSSGITLAKTFMQIGHDIFTNPDRSTYTKNLTAKDPFDAAALDSLDYLRGEASPFGSLATDLASQSDFMKRPLPQQPFGRTAPPPSPYWQQKRGIEPYTWPEYGLTKASPIPVQQIVQEGFRKSGMDESNASRWTKILFSSAAQMASGIHVAKDTHEGQ